MSFILDALERARRDRDALSVDAVLPDTADSVQPHPRRSRLPVLLAFALVLALAVIAWLWITRPSTPGVERQAEAAGLPSPQPLQITPGAADSPGMTATAPPQSDQRRAQGDSSAIAGLYAAARNAAAQAESAQVDAVPAQAPTEGINESELPATTQTPEKASAPPEDAAPPPDVMVDALVARAEAALDNRGLAAHPAPMLDELSKALRDEIPTLMYSQHDYHASGEESSVYINRERRREGDSISGVRVQQILPDSVILRYGDTVFRLRALNSWVNL